MAQRTRKSKRGKQAVQEKQGPSTMVLVLGGVAVLALAVVIWNVVSGVTDRTVRSHVEIDFDSPGELLEMATPVVRGDPDAPITLMDFSDYSCPACRDFASRVKPTLNRVYVDTGLLRFEYYDFPPPGMFPNSYTASRAARCAGDQDAYWAFHDRLYQNQSRWSTLSDPVRTFEGYAEEIGVDRGDFRDCLRGDRHAETVTANFMLGQQLGVTGTPTVMLNTGEGAPVRINQWNDVDAVRSAIDAALERGGHIEANEENDG